MDPNANKPTAEAALRGRVEGAARRAGVARTAAALGVSRESLLGVVAGMPVRAGTLALIREREHFLDGLAAKLVGAQ